MRIMWRFLVALVVYFSSEVRAAKTLDVDKHLSKLSEANIKFSIGLYKQLVQDESTKNLMFSPVSISAAMAMIHLGAKGDTAKQIDDTFMFSDIEDGKFHSAFGELHGLMFDKKSDNITLKSSNRVFAGQQVGVLGDYKNALTVYGAQIDEMDFGNADASAGTVNKWAEESTNGKIRDLVSKSDFTPDLAMIVANTIYFKGDWHSKFTESQTENRAFYVSHYKVVDTPFMFQRGKFRFGYVESLTLQIVQLDYAGKEFSMIILLPENFDLHAVEQQLNYDNLTNWISTMDYQNIDLTLPKFKLEESLELHKIFPNMGVEDVFQPGKADLSGISTSAPDLHIDQVMHKAVLEVNEQGGSVEAERADAARSKNFKVVYADHPFMIVIQSKSSRAFHLMGAFKKPWGRVKSHDEL